MSDQAVAEASASATDLLEGVPEGEPYEGPWWIRAAVAYVLSRNDALVNAQIDRLARARAGKEDRYWEGSPLLAAATTDLERAAALGKHARLGQYSLDLVATHGMDAKPILEEAFERGRQHSALQYLKHERAALKLLGVST